MGFGDLEMQDGACSWGLEQTWCEGNTHLAQEVSAFQGESKTFLCFRV